MSWKTFFPFRLTNLNLYRKHLPDGLCAMARTADVAGAELWGLVETSACLHGHMAEATSLQPARLPGLAPPGTDGNCAGLSIRRVLLRSPKRRSTSTFLLGPFASLVQQEGLLWVHQARSLPAAQASWGRSCEDQPPGQRGREVTDRPG